jgi:hypothetical protein
MASLLEQMAVPDKGHRDTETTASRSAAVPVVQSCDTPHDPKGKHFARDEMSKGRQSRFIAADGAERQ